jgi:hypothetical protein
VRRRRRKFWPTPRRAKFASARSARINLSKTLILPIGNGLGCGCCYDCPVDVEINYVGN